MENGSGMLSGHAHFALAVDRAPHVHAAPCDRDVFNVQRHLLSRATFHRFRAAAHHTWNEANSTA
jgi:hypothetical protein